MEQLIIKILLPVELARDYTAVTDTNRTKTIVFTSEANFFGGQIPPFLIPYVVGDISHADIDDIFEMTCDWDTLMKIIKENKEKYKILSDPLIE